MDTLKELLSSVIGVYTPNLDANDFGQLDIEYICSFILLCCLVCILFKSLKYIFGGLLKCQ